MDTKKEEYLHLQASEGIVAQMAATVFGSLINNTPLHNSNEDELIEKAVSIAIKIALRTETSVRSDQEGSRRDSGSAFLA